MFLLLLQRSPVHPGSFLASLIPRAWVRARRYDANAWHWATAGGCPAHRRCRRHRPVACPGAPHPRPRCRRAQTAADVTSPELCARCTRIEGGGPGAERLLCFVIFLALVANRDQKRAIDMTRAATKKGIGIGAGEQAKSGFCNPNFVKQTASCDHKPRAVWVFVRLLLNRRKIRRCYTRAFHCRWRYISTGVR